MKIACGTDIIEIERVKNSIENTNGRFIKEVFTPREIEYCESKKNMKYQHYAARFSAKEAVFKAINRFVENKYILSWQNMEIQNEENGKPNTVFINVDFPQIISIDVSISHCKDYAVANAVILYEEED